MAEHHGWKGDSGMSITLRETATGALWHYQGDGQWIREHPWRGDWPQYKTTSDLLDEIAEGLKVTA